MKSSLKLLALLSTLLLLVALCACEPTIRPEITFDTQGGSPVDSETIFFGQSVTEPTTTKDGYVFDGWYAGDEKWDFEGKKALQNVTLTAKWTPITYAITYDLGGGVTQDALSESYNVESEDITLPTPTRAGYNFLGWTYEGAEAPVLTVVIPKGTFGELSYTAVWSVSDYAIEYNLGGGKFKDTVTYVYTTESENIVLQAPERIGYTFAGWTYEGVTEPVFSAIIPKGSVGNKSFTANWTPITYTLDFDLRGGTASELYHSEYTIESDDIIIAAPTKTGYNFLGWTYEGAEAPVLTVVIPKGSVGNLSYTAVWSVSEYAIEYILGGGRFYQSVPRTYTIESDDITISIPDRNGYTFAGWTYEGVTEPTMTVVISGGSVGNKSFTANWTPITYTLDFDLRGGTEPELYPSEYSIESDDIVIAAPTKTGYNFLGWTYDGAEAPIPTLVITKGSVGNRSYTAVWSASDYAIAYVLGGGSFNGSVPHTYTTEDDDIILQAPERVGYTFLGWTYDGVIAPTKVAIIQKGSIGNKSFTANWAPVTYTLDFNLGGGYSDTAYPEGYSVESNDITLQAPERVGYTFSGWTYEGVTVPTVTVVIPTGSIGNKTFTANWTPITYTIDFDLRGGSAGAKYPTEYNVESENITIKAPTKAGYNFIGWTYDGASVPVLTLVIPTGTVGNLSYTAVWSVSDFAIEYILGGGRFNVSVPYTYTTESENITLATPERVGYTFSGWTYDGVSVPTMTAVIEKGSIGNKTFTANWTPITYTLEFDLAGGNAGAKYPAEYTTESADIVIKAPTRDGYEFIGWKTSSSSPIIDLVIKNGSTGNKKYTACWRVIEYKIEYDLDGGSFSVDFSESYNTETGTIILPSPDKKGYTFLGWTTDGVNTPTKNLEIPTGSLGNKSFTAVWEIVEYTYEIALGDGNTIPTSYTVESDDITLPTPTKRGYTFLGWTYEGVSTPELVVVIKHGSIGDKLFTANWQINYYGITIDTEGGTLDTTYPDSYTVEDSDIVIGDPVRKGYTFLGWKVNGGSAVKSPKISHGSIGDYTFVAAWRIVSYSITYEGMDGANNTNPSYYTVEDEDITLLSPSKRGYTFLGWTFDGVSAPSLSVTVLTDSTKNYTFTANWSLNTYDITYDLAGGSVEGTLPESFTVISDDITIPNPTKAGYDFLGWKVNGKEPVKNLVIDTYSAENISVVAVFAPTKYSITYEGVDGADNPNSDYYTVEDGDISILEPTKRGYTFLGWTYEGVSVPTKTVTIPAGSTKSYAFTANWSLNTYTITYDLAGGSVEGTLPESFTVISDDITIPNPTKAGYDFLGWRLEGAEPVLSLVITKGTVGNKTYTAVFTPTEYKIEYDLDGGSFSVDFDEVYTTESETIILPSPERVGYTFIGWTTDGVDTPTEGLEIAAGSLGDKSFTAHWSIITYNVQISVGEGGSYEGTVPTSYTVESDSFTLPTPTKFAYTFTGWTWEGQTTPVIKVVIETGSTGDRLFKANWTPTKYAIIYNDMGNAENPNPSYYTIEDDTITITAPSRYGHDFLGWTYEGATEPTMTYVIEAGSTGEVYLTATWHAYAFNITYQNTKGATNPNPALYLSGEKVITLSPLSKSGYTFVGWYDAAGNKVSEIAIDASGDLVLTARWNSTAQGTTTLSYTQNSDGSYTVSGYSGSGAIVIPSTYNGKPVTAIANNAFKNKTNITSVVISDGITSIGQNAFYGCTNITSITIGADVKTIGTYAFYNCKNVTEIKFNAVECQNLGSSNNYAFYKVGTNKTSGVTVTIGADVVRIPGYLFSPYTSNNSYAPKITSVVFEANSSCKEIGISAFRTCANLKSIELPESIKTIESNAFYSCGFESFTIPEGVTTIGSSAFYGCSSLTSITIPESVTSIGNSAFYNCLYLQTVYFNATEVSDYTGTNSIFSYAGNYTDGLNIIIGKNVKRIPNYMFSSATSSTYNPKIVSVVFEEGSICESIGQRAFYYAKIESISFPPSLKTIEQEAFYYCSTLATVEITSPIYVNKNAFYNVNSITALYVSDIATWCAMEYADAYATIMKSKTVLYVGGALLNELVIPEGVTSIGQYAFYYATNLTSISLPDSLETIGKYAFAYCQALTSLTFTGDVAMDDCAFYQCSSLTDINAPEVKNIGKYAFAYCNALTSVYLPSVNEIGDSAFYQCSALEDVNLGIVLENIGTSAFYYCTKLARVALSDTLTVIDSNAFFGCSALEYLTLPASLTYIGSSAFQNCTTLKDVVLPNSLTYIGSNAFQSCTSITKINFPKSVTTVGSGAFYGCTSLASFTVQDVVAFAAIDFGSDTANPAYLVKALIIDGKELTELVLPDGATKVGQYAFIGLESLKTVILPDSVTSIGLGAFRYCSNLETVDFGKGLTSLGNVCFEGCTSLKAANIPEGITAIPYRAFYLCESIETLTLPESLVSISEDAFRGCYAVTSVVLHDNVTTIGIKAFMGCIALSELTIGENVKTISDDAFYNCYALETVHFNAKNVTNLSSGSTAFMFAGKDGEGITLIIGEKVTNIPDYLFYANYNPGDEDERTKFKEIIFAENSSLTRIGKYAFGYTNGLTEITIPDGVTAIEDSTFYFCKDLKKVTLPEGIITIGANAFYANDSLSEIVIPSTVTQISRYAFAYCDALEKVTLNEGLTTICERAFAYCSALDSIVIPDSVTSVEQYAFQNCTGLTGVTLGNGIKYLSSYMFSNCTALTEVVIPDGYTTVIQYAFQNCTALTKITLPETLTRIDQYAFTGCKNLYEVVGLENVTSFSSYAFNGCSSLEKFTLSSELQTIPQYMFYGCTALKSVVIPDSVTSIGNYAFSGCTGLESLTIGKGVTSLTGYAFQNCTGLTEINFNATSMHDLSANNYVFSLAGTESDGIVFTIGKDVTKLPAYLLCPSTNNTLAYAMNVKAIVFEDGSVCTSIGNYAFAYLTGLKSVEIPEGVTLGSNVFYLCRDLESYEIPSGTTSIPNYFFYGCSGLKSITIPDTVTSIGSYAFYGCTSLKEIIIPEGVTSISSNAFYGCTSLESVTLPSTLTTIYSYAFYGCAGLESITIPENVTYIYESAFGRCYGLTEINFNAKTLNAHTTSYRSFAEAGIHGGGITLNIGKSVTRIPNYLFYATSADTAPMITKVVFAEDGVCSSIGQYAFYYGIYLVTFTIPESMTSIETKAFAECTRLIEVKNDSALTVTPGSTANGYVACYAKNVYAGDGTSKIMNINGILYYKDEATSTYTAIGCDDGITELIFAENIEGNSYAIAQNAFRGRSGITKVVFTSGITAIGDNAFYGCSGITGIDWPSQITAIGSYVFYGCSGLQEITIPDTVSSIGQYAFYGCSGIKTLSIGKGVSSLGKYSFYGLSTLETLLINSAVLPSNLGSANYVFYQAGINGDGITVIFGKDVTRVPSYIFCPYGSNSPKLDEVIFEDGSACTSIGAYAFYNTGIKKITLPESLTGIETSAFANCYYLEEIVINSTIIADLVNNTYAFNYAGQYGNGITVTVGKSVTRLPAYLFYAGGSDNSPKVVSLVFEEGAAIKSIGTYLFYYNKYLTSVYLPSSLLSVDSNAFYNCSGIESVYVDTLNDWLNISFGSAMANPAYFGTLYVGGEALTGKLVIPEGVESIGSYSFYGNSDITEIQFPVSLVTIGQYAFGYCPGITELYVNARYVDSYAFINLTALETLTIGEGVESLASHAFFGCSKLSAIYFNAQNCQPPASSNSGSRVFALCGSSADGGITLVIGNKVTKIPAYLFATSSYDEAPYITSVLFEEDSVCTEIGNYAFTYVTHLSAITLPDSLKTIGRQAFLGCGFLEVDLNEVDKIGDYAFSYCSNLTSFTAEKLTVIPAYAFQGCTSLTEFVIGDSITEVNAYAFQGCTSLTTITFGKGVTYIGSYVLDGCTALTTVYFNAENYTYSEEYTKDSPFHTKTAGVNAITFVIGKDVKVIPAYFLYSENGTTPINVTLVVFEEGSVCERIGNYAFYNLSSLGEINIPNSVTYIGEYAFGNCTALTDISIPANLERIGDYAFNNTGLTYSVYDGVNYIGSKDNPYLIAVGVADTNEITELIIHPDAIIILGHAFYNQKGIQSVKLGDKLVEIGACAFEYCSSLTSVEFGSSLKYIRNNAFSNTAIVNAALPDSLEHIGSYAFAGCTMLKTLRIGKNVSVIDMDAFRSCTALTEIRYNAKRVEISNSYSSPFYYAGTNASGITFIVGADVVEIPNYLFYGSVANLTSVIFEEGSVCTVIGEYAFRDCQITELILPDSLIEIKNSAFYGCKSLKTVTMGNSLTTIDIYAFYNCTALTDFVMSEALTSIGSGAFNGCSSLKSIVIPAGVTEMPYGLFTGCSSLESLTLPFVGKSAASETNNYYNHIGYIFGSSQFTGSTYVYYRQKNTDTYTSTYYLPSTLRRVTVLGGELTHAFYGCKMITEITLGKGVTSIDETSFVNTGSISKLTYNVKSLPSTANIFGGIYSCQVIIGKDVESLPDNIFGSRCSSVVFEDGCSLTSIGAGAFSYNSSITEINVPSTVTYIGNGAFAGCTNLTSITLPEGVTRISDSLFSNCTSLSSLTIKGDITSIGSSAFYQCPITEFVIPNTVTEIGSGAFSYTLITEITLPESITVIANDLFNGCSQLVRVVLEGEIISIGSSAFYNCTSLTALNLGNKVETIGNQAFYCTSSLTEITLPEGLVSIGNSAFKLSAITSVTIPDSVTEIGESAFASSSLTSIVIGSGVAYISSSMLRDCTALTEVIISENVTKIGPTAFYGCKALKSVTMHDGITAIYDGAFYGCSALEAIDMPASLTEIGQYAFYECSSLSGTIVIPDGVTYIPYEAFYNCKSITEVVIGDGVTSIDRSAFSGCSSLTKVTIGRGVTYIGYYAFSGCSSLSYAVFLDPSNYDTDTEWHHSSSTALHTYINHTDCSNASTMATYLKSTYVEGAFVKY